MEKKCKNERRRAMEKNAAAYTDNGKVGENQIESIHQWTNINVGNKIGAAVWLRADIKQADEEL